MFYNGFEVFLQGFQMHVSSISSVLRRMLQVLHLDVSKVNWVLHLTPSSPSAASPRCLHLLSAPARHPNQRRRRAPPPPLLLDAGSALWDREQAAVSTRGARVPSVPLRGGGIGALVFSVMRRTALVP